MLNASYYHKLMDLIVPTLHQVIVYNFVAVDLLYHCTEVNEILASSTVSHILMVVLLALGSVSY